MTRTIPLLVKDASPSQIALRRRTFVVSSSAVDSHGDVVDQSTWDLARYKSNPIVLFSHDRGALPIGKSVSCGVVNGALECEIQFAPESANPEAEKCWQLSCQGMLNAASIGFKAGNARREVRDGVEVQVLSECELYEVSLVPLGSNPDAISKAMAAAGPQRTDIAAAMADIEKSIGLYDDEDEDLGPQAHRRELASKGASATKDTAGAAVKSIEDEIGLHDDPEDT